MSVYDKLLAATKMLSAYRKRNSVILSENRTPCLKNRVNLHYFITNPDKNTHNLGDYLSCIVVDYMKKCNGISDDTPQKTTKHFYAIGSILGNGFQNATVWGSGFMNNPNGSFLGSKLHNHWFRKLDVRAVRGPLTANALRELGHVCPDCYGDPAMLMPMIYTPKEPKCRQPYCVINHCADLHPEEVGIPILTTDYQGFIDRIAESNRVISSSLHGIILAESYGIPAVLYMPDSVNGDLTLYKYQDYYFGTGRTEFPVARTIEEAKQITPCQIPDFSHQRKMLFDAFPSDLWEK